MQPMHLIQEGGISSLESYFVSALPKLLKGYAPRKKIVIKESFKSINKKTADYFRERPILFAILLVVASQVMSAIADDAKSFDAPPDFPF
jgi:hypothetical protein